MQEPTTFISAIGDKPAWCGVGGAPLPELLAEWVAPATATGTQGTTTHLGSGFLLLHGGRRTDLG